MSPADLSPAGCGLAVTGTTSTPDLLVIAVATAAPTARCPACGHPSDRVHSRYRRTLADLPVNGRRFVLRLTARRFLCRHPGCGRAVFCERLPGLVDPRARSTRRLAGLHRVIGFALGGEPGSRLAGELAAPISGDTILRRVKATPDEPEPAYRYVGVDDFALRKGHTYGTILIDLERGRVIDILDGRDGAAVEGWLKAHPGVEVITRDRWSAYANAATAGAPQATQVADRWHLLRNLREVIEPLFERHAGAVRDALAPSEPAAPTPTTPPSMPPVPVEPMIESAPPTAGEPDGTEGRRRRVENHRRVHELRRQGLSSRQIARHLRLSRNVVRRYLRTDHYIDGRGSRPPRTRLDGFTAYVDQRIREGCRNAAELYRELTARGCRSSPCAVRRFMNRRMAAAGARRERANASPSRPPRPPSARSLSYQFIRRPADRTETEQSNLDRLRGRAGEIGTGLDLGEELAGMIRRTSAVPLADWLARAEASGLQELVGFVQGVRQDEAAVAAALTTGWSNGPVEGQVNRLKTIKRSGYGRSGFRLLRARVRAKP
jgi:transposase